MAEPQKQDKPAEKPVDTEAKLAAAKAELARLKATKELEATLEEIDNLRIGGTVAHRARMKKCEAIREKTLKENGPDGKPITAVYLIPHKGFRDAQLHEANHIVRLPIDKLPVHSWLPVERTAAAKKTEYAAVK